MIAKLLTSATAYTSYNSPDTPGNWNLPSDSGFGADLGAHTLPEINIRYKYPNTDASDLLAAAQNEESAAHRLAAVRGSFIQTRGQADIDNALNQIALTDASDSPNMDSFMLGLQHSARPHRHSFLKFAAFDPFELLPTGIAKGMKANMDDNTPYTLVLHAPEESTAGTNSLVDSFAKIETGVERDIEASALAGKQSLMHNELQRIDDLVANSRRRSFLKGIYGSRKADYEIDLHAPSESKADISGDINSILKVSSSRASSGAKQDQALKSALLSAEIAKIGRIVRGRH
jgi:hypothetical protein